MYPRKTKKRRYHVVSYDVCFKLFMVVCCMLYVVFLFCFPSFCVLCPIVAQRVSWLSILHCPFWFLYRLFICILIIRYTMYLSVVRPCTRLFRCSLWPSFSFSFLHSLMNYLDFCLYLSLQLFLKFDFHHPIYLYCHTYLQLLCGNHMGYLMRSRRQNVLLVSTNLAFVLFFFQLEFT